MSKKTTQRIKLRMRGNPVRLDATIIDMARDGKWLTVRFDGPLDDMKLYRWSENWLITRELGDNEVPAQYKDCLFFEVL